MTLILILNVITQPTYILKLYPSLPIHRSMTVHVKTALSEYVILNHGFAICTMVFAANVQFVSNCDCQMIGKTISALMVLLPFR